MPVGSSADSKDDDMPIANAEFELCPTDRPMCDWGGDGDKVWSDGESSRAMEFSEVGIKVKGIGWGVKLGGNDTV